MWLVLLIITNAQILWLKMFSMLTLWISFTVLGIVFTHLSRLMTKPTKWHVCQATTQISLGISPVWSESSLSAQWVAKDPSFLRVDRDDSDQTVQNPRLIWVFAGHTGHLVVFFMLRHICRYTYVKLISTYTAMYSFLWSLAYKACGRKAITIRTGSSEFGTYRLCKQRRFRRACAFAQSRQNLRCSLIQAVSQQEPSDRKPDPWPLWMAGHAQLKFVMTECSKTQIRLMGLICTMISLTKDGIKPHPSEQSQGKETLRSLPVTIQSTKKLQETL